MPRSHLDHIVITAPSLALGREYVHEALGVTPQPGGEHARMGTHNCFVKLSDRVYLEVISANPASPSPGRPRWFRLDEPEAVRAPRLAAWLARTDDIHAAASASPVFLGNVEPMSRGPLHWLITIPQDGGLPLDGLAPMLIQWPPEIHPTNTLEDLGCSLIRFEGFHPEPERAQKVLDAIGLEGGFSVSRSPPGGPPCLVARIRTPAGERELRSA